MNIINHPHVDKLPHVEIITATESAIRNNNLDSCVAEELRTKVNSCLVNAKLPHSNISNEQREAIVALNQDSDILVLPADKGRCTVVIDKSDYVNKANDLLSDTKVYQPLKRDPTSGYKKKVSDSLKALEESEAIDRALYYKLSPSESVPRFYGLPKIHKQNVPLRPIVSCISSVTYNLAKHLAGIIGPLVGKSCHHVVNSTDLVDKLKDIKVESDETITSYDVSALFTSVPPEGAVNAVKEALHADNTLGQRTNLNVDQICSLLELCLNSTYFVFEGKFYKQNHGCAMGSPVSPIVANLYMERFEQTALDSYNGISPSHWFRYVDDTLVKIKKSELDPFFDHINSVDSNIKFTQEDVSEKLKRIFGQHQIPVSLKPCNTLRQKLVHPKDKIPQRKQSNIVYAINCQDSDCENYYIGETKQPLHKRMYQHRRPSSTGLNDSAVYTHLKAAKHNFEDKDVIVLDKEHRWYERGVKEAIYVRRRSQL
ncbi:uncharacterized protein [Amphiura filiformis]|uniref:uncharacterized protein n=1 Tax=Amphiura filiformis TaxID=82378 RepID=UPI003B22088A